MWTLRGAICGFERSIDYVDPDDHAGAATVWSVIYLSVWQRRRIAIVEETHVMASTQCIAHMALAEKPTKPLRKEREDVDDHLSGAPEAG
jgi:hypothetical protein